MKAAAHEIRKRLLSWGPGDRQRVERLYMFNCNPELQFAVDIRANLYVNRFLEEPRKRCEFEAI